MLPAFFPSLVCALFLAPLAYAGPYSQDWQAFEKELDRSYPFFKVKGIGSDWSRAKRELKKEADKCQDDSSFLVVVDRAIRTLRDGHAHIVESRGEFPGEERYGLPVSFRPAAGGEVVVAASRGALKPGTVVTRIDGVPARRFMDDRSKESWKQGGYFSSPQRAAFMEYAMPLRAEEVKEHVLVCRGQGGETTVRVKNDYRGRLSVYQFPKGLKRGEGSCLYGKTPGGFGYLYLRRMKGDETAAGLERALAENAEVPGWVVDLRGNGGGGHSEALDAALTRIASKPLAVLIDAGCFSSGETCARELKRMGGKKARLFGSATAGSSSSKKDWSFPSGVATVRFSVASRKGLNGKPIEFYGIEPDVAVESNPEDIARGVDTEMLAAEKYLEGAG